MNINKKEISIVIPIYNESSNINPVISELESFLKENMFNYEIVIVNDGSTDNSSNILIELSEINSKIKVIDLSQNKGQSFAIYKGVQNAKYKNVLIMDGDGQYDPKDIDKFYSEFIKGFDVVCGYRLKRQDDKLYKISSLFGNKLFKTVFGIKTNDLGCGLKLVHKDQFLAIPFFKNMHRYLPIVYHFSKKAILEIEINHRNRLEGESKYSSFKVIGVLGELIRLKKNLYKYTSLLKQVEKN